MESIPGKVSGAWVFKDTRRLVATVFEKLEAGWTVEEVMEEFFVTRGQINAVLRLRQRACKPLCRLRYLRLPPPMLVLFDHGTPE